MKENIIKAIKKVIDYPQNAHRTVENIVDSALGVNAGSLTDKEKAVIAKNITHNLNELDLVSDPARLFASLSVVLLGYVRQ